MRIMVIGGDERMFAVINGLLKDGHTVFSAALPKRGDLLLTAVQTLNIGECPAECEAVILPFPAFKGGFLNSPLVKERYTEAEILSSAEGKTVIGGNLPFCDKTHIDYGKDEKLLAGNAELTAEGALALIIKNTPESVSGSLFAVTGWGRIAKSLAFKLKALGGRVLIIARSSNARGEAIANGFEAAGFDSTEAPFLNADAIINTVPSRVITEDMLASVKKNALFLELASPPYGAAEAEVLSSGANYLLAPGIPGKFSPQTAGELIYGCIKSILPERG